VDANARIVRQWTPLAAEKQRALEIKTRAQARLFGYFKRGS
jgi:hypothetical protein